MKIHRMEKILSEHVISEKLKYTISVSMDDQVKYLNVDYMDGAFSIGKIFQNNIEGNQKLQSILELINTEEKIEAYLNI